MKAHSAKPYLRKYIYLQFVFEIFIFISLFIDGISQYMKLNLFLNFIFLSFLNKKTQD